MNYSERQQITNPRTGKVERVFVNLEAIYPNRNDPSEEMSFEELRARARGWTNRDWAAENVQMAHNASGPPATSQENEPRQPIECISIQDGEQNTHYIEVSDRCTEIVADEGDRALKQERPKKMKIREIKAETQTSMYFAFPFAQAYADIL